MSFIDTFWFLESLKSIFPRARQTTKKKKQKKNRRAWSLTGNLEPRSQVTKTLKERNTNCKFVFFIFIILLIWFLESYPTFSILFLIYFYYFSLPTHTQTHTHTHTHIYIYIYIYMKQANRSFSIDEYTFNFFLKGCWEKKGYFLPSRNLTQGHFLVGSHTRTETYSWLIQKNVWFHWLLIHQLLWPAYMGCFQPHVLGIQTTQRQILKWLIFFIYRTVPKGSCLKGHKNEPLSFRVFWTFDRFIHSSDIITYTHTHISTKAMFDPFDTSLFGCPRRRAINLTLIN